MTTFFLIESVYYNAESDETPGAGISKTELLFTKKASFAKRMARPGGLEPPTCGLEISCSIRLSYGRFKGDSRRDINPGRTETQGPAMEPRIIRI